MSRRQDREGAAGFLRWRRRGWPAIAAMGCLLAVGLGCTQNVAIQIHAKPGDGDQFVIASPERMDRRYWEAGHPRRFPSGSVVNLDKGGAYTIAVVDEAGARSYEAALVKYPKRWYELVLTPVFGLGHAMWRPYPDPYVINPVLSADQQLRLAAERIGPDILSRLPKGAKTVGLFTLETDVVEKGRAQPYASEGNRRLSEYIYNYVRKEAAGSVRIRRFKMGIDWYLKHSYDSLGESVEARHELAQCLAHNDTFAAVLFPHEKNRTGKA